MIYNLKLSLLFILLVSALLSDIRTYKIKNPVTLLFLTAGFLVNTLTYGIKGFGDSLIGSVLPLFVLIILFAVRMLGAGDIKLFCSIGALMGVNYIMYCMAFSFMAGGIIALFIMLTGKSFLQRFKYLGCYLKSCYLTSTILPYGDFTVKNDGTKMRFSYAVTAGTLLYQIYILYSR